MVSRSLVAPFFSAPVSAGRGGLGPVASPLYLTFTFAAILLCSACEDVGPLPIEMVPTDVGAAWSPDGSMLAVDYRPGDASSAADGVYIVDVATGNRTFIAPFAGGPDWSPDGSKLAFTGGGTIGVADLSSGDVTVLDLPDFSLYPSWSPDGNTIAFSSVIDISNPPVLFLMDSDGTDARRIPLPLPRSELAWPDWSPTGDRIVAFEWGTEKRLLVTDTLAKDTARITPVGIEANEPTWSPNGDWIAYTRRTGGRQFDVHLVRPDGTEDRILVSGGFDPTWSPDGQSIAFSRQGDSNVAVWAIGIDGDGLRQLTDPE